MKGTIHSKGAYTTLWRWRVNFIFAADTDSENTSLLINNKNFYLLFFPDNIHNDLFYECAYVITPTLNAHYGLVFSSVYI